MSFEPTNEDAIRQSAFADGEAYAEARIINLLEQNCECEEMQEYGYRQCAPHYAIELIKGKAE